ncbi:hypothetical protein BU17DRAFT_60495 [Hysterangium stoloniferum]|nr:hypothetical protein BU17DRAFT_60495 [Hysterangium stoloniferum]
MVVRKVIFFLNTYSPIIDTTLTIYIQTGVKDQRLCPALSTATAGAFVGGMFVSEIVLAMRTYAIWGCRRSILIFLVLFTLTYVSSAVVQIPAFLEPSLRITCAPLPARGQTGFEFMVFMVNQAVVAILTLYRAMQQYRLLLSLFRPLRVISSICCTRVLLNIRGAYFTPNSTSETGLVVANKNFPLGKIIHWHIRGMIILA